MGLLQTKKDFEQFFFDNYSETAVHWAGMNFDTTEHSEWVYFEYVGTSMSTSSISSSNDMIRGYLDISVYANTRFRVSQIADLVCELFDSKKISGMFVRGIDVLSTGTIVDINKSYIDFNINLSSV